MITTLGEAAGQDVWTGKKRRHSSPSAASLLSEQPLSPLRESHPLSPSLPFPPSPPPFLNCQDGSPPRSHCFMQIFISVCEMYSRAQQKQPLNRSSGLSHTPRAAVSTSPFAFAQPLRSQVKSSALDLVSSWIFSPPSLSLIFLELSFYLFIFFTWF